jgi:hypothetical protein
MTTSYMGYILIMFNHCVHACVCERACASTSVIKRSLIFERILFEFGGDIKQIPIGYICYLICVWMYVLTARTCLHLRICLARDGQWLVVSSSTCNTTSTFLTTWKPHTSESCTVEWNQQEFQIVVVSWCLIACQLSLILVYSIYSVSNANASGPCSFRFWMRAPLPYVLP